VQVAQRVWELKDGPAHAGAAPGIAEPVLLEIEEPEPERWVEIIDPKSGGKVITVIEVLSPRNKEAMHGANLYLSKRQSYFEAGVNVLEINLLRGGVDVCMVPATMLKPAKQSLYRACVYRAAKPRRREVYPMPLRQPLPILPVPLRTGEADARLNLQELIERVYRQGRYDTMDYAAHLEAPLNAEDAQWAAELTEAQRLAR
jgi:hypothetical protein